MTAAPIETPVATPSTGRRLLAATTPDHRTHLDTHGRLPALGGRQLLEEVTASGLTGRGGAGFPAAVKLAAVAAAGQRNPQNRPVVVGNAAEGEPASRKDRHLLLRSPHLVLDGLQMAALITGAGEAFVYLRPDTALAVRRALHERAGSGDRLPVTVVEAAPGFVSGQETAVVSRVNSGAALPKYAPVRVAERGVHGRPTLVQNVETLAHLALIARHGGAWFAEVGSAGATGTFLATVHQPDAGFELSAAHPNQSAGQWVWEVPHGLPLSRLLAAAADADRTPESADGLQAVLIGGFHGSWLRWPQARDAPLSAAGLAPYGGGLGAGVIMPLTTRTCGLAVTARIVRYLAGESAKQCGPCAFGLPRLAGQLTALAGGAGGRSAVESIRQTVGLVDGRGACSHPDGTARLVRSALLAFEHDVALHSHGRCVARIGEPYGGAA